MEDLVMMKDMLILANTASEMAEALAEHNNHQQNARSAGKNKNKQSWMLGLFNITLYTNTVILLILLYFINVNLISRKCVTLFNKHICTTLYKHLKFLPF